MKYLIAFPIPNTPDCEFLQYQKNGCTFTTNNKEQAFEASEEFCYYLIQLNDWRDAFIVNAIN